MIDENLQVAQTISGELVNKVLLLSMEEVARYGKMYKGSIIDYKDRYFKDRGAVSENFIEKVRSSGWPCELY